MARLIISANKLPEDVNEAILLTLIHRPPVDLLIFYARWHIGMTFADIADRVGHTTEYVRIRLNSMYDEIRQHYESTHKSNYIVSTIEENDNGPEHNQTRPKPVERDSKDGKEENDSRHGSKRRAYYRRPRATARLYFRRTVIAKG